MVRKITEAVLLFFAAGIAFGLVAVSSGAPYEHNHALYTVGPDITLWSLLCGCCACQVFWKNYHPAFNLGALRMAAFLLPVTAMFSLYGVPHQDFKSTLPLSESAACVLAPFGIGFVISYLLVPIVKKSRYRVVAVFFRK